MTDWPEVSPPSPTARTLFESVDALMRRNRREGTEPLPPPEGQPAFAEIDDETQTLSAEIEAELEAELAKELSRVESDTPSGSASPPMPEPMPEPEPADALPVEISEAVIIEEPEKEVEERAAEIEPEVAPENAEPPVESAPVEDDLLLWEFASQSQVAVLEATTPETEAVVEPVAGSVPAEVEETKPAVDEPLASTPLPMPSFSEAISFLSALEVLAPPSQSSASYTAVPPTVTFDGVAAEDVAEKERAATAPAILPEVFVKETTRPEEVIWLPAEEADEIPLALDAGSATDVTEALASLSGAGTAEAVKTAEDTAGISWPQPVAEPAAGFWHLVEPEVFQEVAPVSAAPETASAEIAEPVKAEESAVEATKTEEAKTEESAEQFSTVQADHEPVEAPSDEPSTLRQAQGERNESAHPEAAELTEPALEEVHRTQTGGEIVGEATGEIASEVAGEVAILPTSAVEERASGIEQRQKQDEGLFIEPRIFEPVVRPPIEAAANRPAADAVAPVKAMPEILATPKMMGTFPAPAAALLSEQQQRFNEIKAGEVKTSPVHYSAAQLLTEYQHQHPQAQNVKAAVATPPAARSAMGATLTLVDEHDSLSTFNEAARKGAKAKQAEKVPLPAEAIKETPPKPVTGALPDVDAKRSAASASAPAGEEDYYPVLTDVVREDELPVSGKA